MNISYEQYESLRDDFRSAALEGLDNAMREVCKRAGVTPGRNNIGARDADLPKLFQCLDAQFKRNLEELNIEIEEELYDKAEQRWNSQ